MGHRLQRGFVPQHARRRNGKLSHFLNLRVRQLHVEDRRMLTIVTVDTNSDVVDYNDGVTSVREAIFATNLVAGVDTIIDVEVVP